MVKEPIENVDKELHNYINSNSRIELSNNILPALRTAFLEKIQKENANLEFAKPQIVKIKSKFDNSEIELRIHNSTPEKSKKAIFHIHGGGYVVGSSSMNDYSLAQLSISTDTIIISVEYRLAPENPYPIPLNDCLSGYLNIVENSKEYGIDINNIIVMGESAGGGLAAALCQKIRDEELHMPKAQFLIYPMLDCRTGTENDIYQNQRTGKFIWTKESNVFGWNALKGDFDLNSDDIGHFSPALAKSLNNLPPCLIITGELDLFVDENLDYANKLMQADVPTEFHIYKGAVHGFNIMGDTELSRQFNNDLETAIRKF